MRVLPKASGVQGKSLHSLCLQADETAVWIYSAICKVKNGCQSFMSAGRLNECGQLSKGYEGKGTL